MTWIPIWTTASKVLIYPLVIPSLSYGLFAFVASGLISKEVIQGSSLENQKEDEAEMNRWSLTLCDPKSPNYNPFTFIQK
jgi:hypothetical protein